MRLRPDHVRTFSAIAFVTVCCGCGSDSTTKPEPDPSVSVWSEVTNVLPALTLYGLWAPRADYALGVGPNGQLWQWDGLRWTQRVNPYPEDLFAIAGSTTGAVVTVGDDGQALQMISGSLVSRDTGTSENLRGLWRSEAGVFVAVGENGTILRGDGSAWAPDVTVTNVSLVGVWGASENDIFAVGVNGTILHDDGAGWSEMQSGTSQILSAVSGTSGTDVYVVGAEGTLLHYDGVAWTPLESHTTELLQSVCAECGPAAAGANGTVVRFVGGAWKRESVPGAPWLYSIARGGDRLWAVGAHALMTHDGAVWLGETRGTIPILRDLAYSPETGLVAVGENGAVMLGGPEHWTFEDAGQLQKLNAVWITPAGSIFAAGTSRIFHRTDTGWVDENSEIIEYHDLGGNGTNTFAVGTNGALRRRSGSTWASVGLTWTFGVVHDLYAVTVSDTEGFIAGEGGTIFRYDGRTWQQMSSYIDETLWDIMPVAHEEWRAIAVGAGGTSLGLSQATGQWLPMDTPVTSTLHALARGPGGDVFAVGAAGTVLRYSDDHWSTVTVPTSRTFESAWSIGGTLFACGGSISAGGTLFRYGPPGP